MYHFKYFGVEVEPSTSPPPHPPPLATPMAPKRTTYRIRNDTTIIARLKRKVILFSESDSIERVLSRAFRNIHLLKSCDERNIPTFYNWLKAFRIQVDTGLNRYLSFYPALQNSLIALGIRRIIVFNIGRTGITFSYHQLRTFSFQSVLLGQNDWRNYK